MPAAAGRRSLRGTAGVAAGGSGEQQGVGGTGWDQRTRPQTTAAVGKWKEVGGWRGREVDFILEGTEVARRGKGRADRRLCDE